MVKKPKSGKIFKFYREKSNFLPKIQVKKNRRKKEIEMYFQGEAES